MKRSNKKIVIIGLLILLFIAGLGVNQLYAVTAKFGVGDLNDREALKGRTVFCIARNYTILGGIDKQYDYTRDNRIKITGDSAQNLDATSKTSKNKSNAVLAYICYKARDEEIPNTGNTNNWDGYRYTSSQNAIWDYWDVWYANNGSTLGVNKIYNKASNPRDSESARELLNEADVYYNVLAGETGIKAVTGGSKLITKYNGYDYYGPFYIKQTNNKYVNNTLNIATNSNIMGFVSSDSQTNATSSITLSNSYNRFYIRVKKGYLTSKFDVYYGVKQYNATLELYSYYSPYYGRRFQNIASVKTDVGNKNIILTLDVDDKPATVSLQKYIVDSGMSIKEENGTITINGGHYNGSQRLNKKANTDSDTNISAIVKKAADGTLVDYTTAGLFSGNKTKRENPYIINLGEYVVYKIDVYNNSADTKVTCTVKDRIDKNAELIGIFDTHKGSEYNNKLTETTVESKVSTTCYYQYEVEGSDAKYYKWRAEIFPNTFNSFFVILRYNKYVTNLINNKAYVNDNNASQNYQTYDYDFVRFERVNVSLQKYITKVTKKDNTVTYDSTTERKDKKTSEEDDIKDAIKPGVTAKKDYYKYSNPVQIEIGDSVTYRIYVYNNSNVVAQSVLVKDVLPYYLDSSGNVVSYVEIQKILKKGSTNDIKPGSKNGWQYDINSDNGISYEITDLAANSATYFDITVRFNGSYSTKILTNSAWISTTIPVNEATYRTADRDYVQMKQYSVSLEKYITQVTDINGENPVTYNNRSGKRYNYVATNKVTSGTEDQITYYYEAGDSKSKNKVPVEVGDKVTFTIKLKNTGDTPVYVKQIYDQFTCYDEIKLSFESISEGTLIDNEFTADGKWALKDINRYLIEFDGNGIYLGTGEKDKIHELRVTFSVKLDNKDAVSEIKKLYNVAGIYLIQNQDGKCVIDADGIDNNRDEDVVQTKTYAVSLQKIVSSVNKNSTGSSFDRWDSWESNEINDKQKYNNPIEVAKGDNVTYAIKVKNDGSTQVKNFVIQDTLPTSGIDTGTFNVERVEKYNSADTSMTNDVTVTTSGTTLSLNGVLNTNESVIVYASATVTESNMSLNVLRNYAEITGTMQNRNDVDVKDSTPNDNQDADYIQMKDIVISGTVWNDKALDKTQDNYNGQYDSQENKLGGIKVYLYRSGVTDSIATTTTNSNGDYTFSSSNITSGASNERYVKAPKSSGNNRWNSGGTYYSYYVVFEYDGITYTSTFDTTGKRVWDISENGEKQYSNAREKLSDESFDGQVNASRTNFNNRFSKINANGAYDKDNNYTTDITYTTKNEDGYIPQSNHVYNASTMAMQSSTNTINLSNDDNLVNQLQHVNLGLRGRDIFDLELTSDVDNIKVTVNEQQGVYQYSNKVTLRKSDLTPSSTTTEDMANKENESSNKYVDSQEQLLRKTDIYNDKYSVNGTKGDTGLGIEVTYKITVTNASRTDGTATKITNYYDSKYEFKGVYPGENCNKIISAESGTSGSGYNSKTITVRGKTLGQSETMEIYVVYSLKDASTTLSVLLGDGEKRLATFNMAEITEYKTFKTTYTDGTDNEATRGLIDKDSAPGSANKEQVRTTETIGQNTKTTGGNPTTVQYYFGGNDLSKLKYEDDTYATPTLYFVSSDNQRTITGTVFEDFTEINSQNIKSGNGVKDATEPIIKGITVQLIEGNTVRYTTTTDEKGQYEFKDFLPGNYTIKYYYGDTDVTFLKTAPNKESYNGEDFQATNNSYDVSGIDVHKLSTRSNYWYLDNESEGVSTGTDDTSRRRVVSEYFLGENSDEKIQVLNNAKAGNKIDVGTIGADDVKGNSYMYANTKSMTFTLEKSEINDTDDVIQRNQFGNYTISNMNFGIAEISGTTIIDLQKHVESFEITDSTGNNTIASARKNASTGNWELQGDVLVPEGTNTLDVSIEDEKLQGARLQITYAITSQIDVEKNFDGKVGAYATITEVIDYIDNNLSYNNSLGRNSEYWEITERNSIFTDPNVQGTVDPEGKLYTTIVKAKKENPILNSSGGTATITLEKVLSSSDSTFDEIVTSFVDIYAYSNTVEITGINYENTTSGGTASTPGSTGTPRKDLVITPDRYIIIPKEQNDSTSSEVITIHPPTGDSSINIMYYVIATVSLVILALGAFGIKKFVVKNNK